MLRKSWVQVGPCCCHTVAVWGRTGSPASVAATDMNCMQAASGADIAGCHQRALREQQGPQEYTSTLARSDSASSKTAAGTAAVEGCVASAKAPCYRCSSCPFAVPPVPAVLLQIMVLAWPGVVVQFLLIGLCAKYVFPYNWTWPESFLFGAMMAATDPVAVVAVLQEVRVSEQGCLSLSSQHLTCCESWWQHADL